MDPELGSSEDSEPRNRLLPVAVALGIGLLLGGIIVRLLIDSTSDVAVVSGRIGAISTDNDALALEGSDGSFDLTHATLIDCGESPEPGTDVDVGLVRVSTEDVDPPSDAFLNTPDTRVVLWVECLSF